MGGKTGNFSFLEGNNPQLAKLGRLAERYFADDPSAALVKLRQFAEITAKEIAARQALMPDGRVSFDDILRILRTRSILQREVADLFYHLKRAGNDAAHEDKGTASEALTALKIARAIGGWFHQTYGGVPSFRLGSFVPPVPPTDASEALRQEMSHLRQAVAASADAEAKTRLALQEAEAARRHVLLSSAAAASALMADPGILRAQASGITVGFVTGQSGPSASVGIPYSRGIAAAMAYLDTVDGRKIRLVQLDDAGDPSASTRTARKLVEEEKVDLLIGTSGVPGSVAMAAVAAENKVPFVSISPLPPTAGKGEGGFWAISIPQPPPLMVAAVVGQMQKAGVKNVGYIGFSDAWGDLVYNALSKTTTPLGIKILTDERYARPDTSVTAQTLKIIASQPDAVMTGGSGTPGALPFLSLRERGFRGPIYGTHALINPDFIRVGGAAVEGVLAPTGPIIVAEQLPDSNPVKKVGLEFRAAHIKANNAPSMDAFSAYSFDGWMVFTAAAKRALQSAQPGTPAFRAALRDELYRTKDVVGTHGVYSYGPNDNSGVDERARVIVTLEKGQWKLLG